MKVPYPSAKGTEGLTGRRIFRILYTCDKEKLQAAGFSAAAAFELTNSGLDGQWTFTWKSEEILAVKAGYKEKGGTI